MKRYGLVAASLAVVFLLSFWLFSAMSIPLLEDPMATAERLPRVLLAAFSVGLLVSDVLLPVPSSIVMLANGVAFGFLPGTAISVLGGMGASLFGFGLGRLGARFAQRKIPLSERLRFDALLQRWGVLAIVVTRPVPIVAETVSMLAGTSSMRWSAYTFASLLGTLPTSAVYAFAGSGFRANASAGQQVVAFVGVCLLGLGGELLRRRLSHRNRQIKSEIMDAPLNE